MHIYNSVLLAGPCGQMDSTSAQHARGSWFATLTWPELTWRIHYIHVTSCAGDGASTLALPVAAQIGDIVTTKKLKTKTQCATYMYGNLPSRLYVFDGMRYITLYYLHVW